MYTLQKIIKYVVAISEMGLEKMVPVFFNGIKTYIILLNLLKNLSSILDPHRISKLPRKIQNNFLKKL